MAAGVVLSALTALVWAWAKKKWPDDTKDHHAIAIGIVLAGITAVAAAWSAGQPIASSETLLGALKIFAGAAMAYAIGKKGIGSLLFFTPSTKS